MTYNNNYLFLIHASHPLWSGSTEALFHVSFTLEPRLMEQLPSGAVLVIVAEEGESGESYGSY